MRLTENPQVDGLDALEKLKREGYVLDYNFTPKGVDIELTEKGKAYAEIIFPKNKYEKTIKRLKITNAVLRFFIIANLIYLLLIIFGGGK